MEYEKDLWPGRYGSAGHVEQTIAGANVPQR